MASPGDVARARAGPLIRVAAATACELAVIAVVYVLLAKFGLGLASIHPSATPIWPPTGLALAAVLLRGYRITLAIFAGAFAVNAMTAGTLATSAVAAARSVASNTACSRPASIRENLSREVDELKQTH